MTSPCRPIHTALLLGLILGSVAGQAQTYDSLCHFIPNNQPLSVDSMKTLLTQNSSGQQRVNLLLRLGGYYVYNSGEFRADGGYYVIKSDESRADLDTALTYAQQAQQLSRKLGYPVGEILSLNLLGTLSKQARQFQKAVAYQQQAIALSKSQRDARRMADSYRLLSEAWRGKEDLQAARKAVQTAIAICNRNGYGLQAAEAYIELGNTYTNREKEVNKRVTSYQRGLQEFIKAGNIQRQADTYKDLGDLYQVQENWTLALIYLRKALSLYRSIHYPHLQEVYDLLSYTYKNLEYPQQALRYGLLAVKTAETLGDTSLRMCVSYNSVGLIYERTKEYHKALFYLKKALSVAERHDVPFFTNTLIVGVSRVYIQLNQSKEAIKLIHNMIEKHPPREDHDRLGPTSTLLRAYTKTRQYTLAQQYCNQLVALSTKLGRQRAEQQLVYFAVIPFYLETKQYRKARKYIIDYESNSKYNHYSPGMESAQLHWSRLDSAQGNYLSAINHYQRYKQLQDSVFNETKSRQLANLEVLYEKLYETEKNEQDLKLKEQSIKALTRTRLLQEERIKREQLIRNGIIATTVLLFLLLTLIYNRYRLKQRSNRLLEAKQQEINQQNEQLQQVLSEKNSLLAEKESLLTHKDNILLEKDGLLQEKQWLLREVHHRVKNNLQVVVSLLSSQAAYLLDEKALLAIQESQNRIHAISLIHQKLYLSENIALIEMNAYIREVADYLLDSFQMDERVQLHIAVDPIELDGAIAVPMGLIINEAVTNSLKYAFPGGRNGQISISLQTVDGQSCLLTIADDGIGLDQAVDLAHTRSLGMVLMKGLTKQLEGTLTIDSTDGLTISLLFNKSSRKVSLEESVR